MCTGDEGLPLGYTQDWITLGIVTAADIAEDVQMHTAGGDPHPEHYRWRAFSSFLASRESLSAVLSLRLYELGAVDPDRSMGAAMMTMLLRRKDCPPELLQAALDSDRADLRKAAELER